MCFSKFVKQSQSWSFNEIQDGSINSNETILPSSLQESFFTWSVARFPVCLHLANDAKAKTSASKNMVLKMLMLFFKHPQKAVVFN